jgi:hypothetical protein
MQDGVRLDNFFAVSIGLHQEKSLGRMAIMKSAALYNADGTAKKLTMNYSMQKGLARSRLR